MTRDEHDRGSLDPDTEWVNRLEQGNPEQRKIAAREIPDPPPGNAVEVLIGALDDVQVEVRVAAIYSLSILGNARAADAVRDSLDSSIPQIRAAAIWALRSLGDRTAAEEVRTLLSRDVVEVRSAAAWYVGDGTQDLDVDALITASVDDDFQVREAVALGLGRTGQARSFDVVESMLEDNVAAVREAACWSLSDANSDHYKEPLRRRLTDPVVAVRLAAANSLKDLGDDAGGFAIDALNGSEDAILRLGRMSESSLVPLLLMLLESDQPGVRQASARALGNSGLVDAEAPLQELRSSYSLRDRMVAARAIGSLHESGRLMVVAAQVWAIITWPVTLIALTILIALAIAARRRRSGIGL